MAAVSMVAVALAAGLGRSNHFRARLAMRGILMA
jgi:hypothetical protein